MVLLDAIVIISGLCHTTDIKQDSATSRAVERMCGQRQVFMHPFQANSSLCIALKPPDAAVMYQCGFELLHVTVMTVINSSLQAMAMICLQQLVCRCIRDQLVHKVPMLIHACMSCK